MFNRERIIKAASAHIKQSEFGINTFLPQLGDDVTIEIDLEAYQSHQRKAL